MRHFLPLILLILMISPAFGQKAVEGKVIAKEDGTAMPGVNVLVEGTSKGTSTDVDGHYRIELGDGETTLNFSFIGYKTVSEIVGDRTMIDVTLESDAKTLDEVVVIGYGTIAKSDLTGSVSSLRGGDITKIPASDPTMALQGKLAGVQVVSSSGAPGSQPIIRIRGTSTFGDSSPIYVVDGVILQDISFLNSSDIQSMEVLKDASATAIYGSRGANGVIMITTKKGKSGPTQVTVSGEVGFQNQQKRIDLLNGPEYATIVNEITPTYNNVNKVPNTDWQDLLFKSGRKKVGFVTVPAPIQNYQVSTSGSSDKGSFYFGIGYFKQNGLIDKSKYERLTIRLNNTYNLGKRVRVGNNITLAPQWTQFTDGNAVFSAYRALPVVTPYDSAGHYNPVPNVGNPLGSINYTNSYERSLRTVGNIYAEVDFAKGFTFKTSFGVDLINRSSYDFTPVFFISPQQQVNPNTLDKSWYKQTSWLWENTLTWNKQISKHKINALVGYTMQDISNDNLSLTARNVLRDTKDFWYVNPSTLIAAQTNNTPDANQNYSLLSYLGRVNYAYDNRFLFTATFRADGSAKFPQLKNKYGTFPSVALGWNVINEQFMQSVPLFSNLKVRASYGVLGNEKISYNKQYSYTANQTAVFGSTLYPGVTYSTTGNPNLKWETTYQTDVGLELGFLDDRLKVEADYYRRDTKGILIDLLVPSYFGLGTGGTVTYNAAEVVNSGFELTIGWQGTIREGWTYSVNGNVTTIKNRVVSVNGIGGTGDYLDAFDNSFAVTRSKPGKSLGEFFMYQTDGLYQNQAELDAGPRPPGAATVGDIRYKDVNNDGKITAADRVDQGSPIPTYMFGLNLGTNYKRWELLVDINGLGGNKIYNQKETVRPDLYNFEKHVLGRWTAEGTSTSEPRSTQGGQNWYPSNRFIQSGAYIRLRSVSISYKVKMIKFYIRGTNLITKTKYTGYTPEIGSRNPILNGIDYGTYPLPAVYSAGFNVTF